MKSGVVVLLAALLGACRTPDPPGPVGPENPPPPRRWTDLPPLAFDPPPYARFLRGFRVCLDPGHGGDAHREGYKRGPTGYREALMNWDVAGFLAEFLAQAGAEAVLTRDGDVDVPLARRAAIALETGCHAFLSLHHNAISGKPEVNYTTVWYHGEPDFSPASLDAARCVYWGLHHALRLPQISEIPLHSDFLMYPKDGFGVLRGIGGRLPAILVEASFFTHPPEEERLKDPDYKKREAWGLFLGLARWVAGGLPRAEFLTATPAPPGEPLRLRLLSGLEGRRAWPAGTNQVLASSFQVALDGNRLSGWAWDPAASILSLPPPPGGWPVGDRRLRVDFANTFKNSNVQPEQVFTVGP